MIEPSLYDGAETLEASMVGHRSGSAVDFTKTYVGIRQGYEDPVDYVGQLSENGNCIKGVWSLVEWNGSFEMYREQTRAAEREREAEISVARENVG